MDDESETGAGGEESNGWVGGSSQIERDSKNFPYYISIILFPSILYFSTQEAKAYTFQTTTPRRRRRRSSSSKQKRITTMTLCAACVCCKQQHQEEEEET